MADLYSIQEFPFKNGDVLKVELNYSIFQGNNRVSHKRNMHLLIKEKEGAKSKITIEKFLDSFIETFLINGFTTIQSNLTRWDSIRVTCNGIVIIKFLKEVFGQKSSATDLQRGFLFELHSLKAGPTNSTSKFYLRGVINEALFFDKQGNSALLEAITEIEKIFINPCRIGDSDYFLQYMIHIDTMPSEVGAAYGRKLHLFKKKENKTKKTNFKYNLM